MTIALLHEKIASFFAAKKAFDAANCDDDLVEWEAFEAAEHAVIVHPCATIDEVRVKANFFLTNDGPYDTIRNCYNSEEETLRPFLRSLLGDGSSTAHDVAARLAHASEASPGAQARAPGMPMAGLFLLSCIVGMAICTLWIAITWRAWG